MAAVVVLALVCLQRIHCTLEIFTNILAGGLDAWSCAPCWFERVVQTCVCLGTFWIPKHLPPF